jgi:serine/threonine protein kinase
VLEGGVIAENEQSGFHEGVTIPVRPVGAGGSLLQAAVKVSTVSVGSEDPRFRKEARVLANLAHPNIVPIYNLGVNSAGRPFYSMKLVKGRTLQSVLNAVREGEDAAVAEFTRARLLMVFRKVCDAMAFAHSKGVLHRDLKPENVMVGEYGEVLVMDWGLAKVSGVEEEVQAVRLVGRRDGVFSYGGGVSGLT